MQVWNDDFADRCVLRHNYEACDQSEIFSYVGENLYNLYASGGSTANYTRAVQRWYNEVEDFDYNSDSFNPSKVCGHYTQVPHYRSLGLFPYSLCMYIRV